jgi:hypothetical protein
MTRVILSFLLLSFGCGDDAAAPDAGRRDAGGARDGGSRDSAIGSDASGDDGGSADAAGTDAALADAGSDAEAPGPCVDDDHEDDDTLAAAMAIPAISGTRGGGRVEVGSFTSCPGDVDYFHAYADCCTVAGADVMFSSGEIEMRLVDPADAMLAYSSDTGGRGRRELRVAEHGGAFFVRIENIGPTPATYDLSVYAMVFTF